MKKLIFLFVCVFSIQVALADNDKPINFTQLPQAAQKFVKQHFPKAKIAFVKMETELFDKSYDVVFNNGDKLEFDKKGEWTEVNCTITTVTWQHNSKICLVELGLANTQQTSTTNISL